MNYLPAFPPFSFLSIRFLKHDGTYSGEHRITADMAQKIIDKKSPPWTDYFFKDAVTIEVRLHAGFEECLIFSAKCK